MTYFIKNFKKSMIYVAFNTIPAYIEYDFLFAAI